MFGNPSAPQGNDLATWGIWTCYSTDIANPTYDPPNCPCPEWNQVTFADNLLTFTAAPTNQDNRVGRPVYLRETERAHRSRVTAPVRARAAGRRRSCAASIIRTSSPNPALTRRRAPRLKCGSKRGSRTSRTACPAFTIRTGSASSCGTTASARRPSRTPRSSPSRSLTKMM